MSHPLCYLVPDTCNVDGLDVNHLKSDRVIIKSVENEDRNGIRSQQFWSDSWERVPGVVCYTLCLGGLRERERTVETRKWQEGQEVSVGFFSFKGIMMIPVGFVFFACGSVI